MTDDDGEWYPAAWKTCVLPECNWTWVTEYRSRENSLKYRPVFTEHINHAINEHIKSHSRADQSRIFEVKVE